MIENTKKRRKQGKYKGFGCSEGGVNMLSEIKYIRKRYLLICIAICVISALLICSYKVFGQNAAADQNVTLLYVKHILYGAFVGIIATVGLYCLIKVIFNESNAMSSRIELIDKITLKIFKRRFYGEQLYLIALAIFVFNGMIGDTYFNYPRGWFGGILTRLCVLLLILKIIFFDKYKKYEWIWPAVLVAASLGCYIATRSWLFVTVFFIIEAKGVNFERIVKVSFITLVSAIIMTFVASLPYIELIEIGTRNGHAGGLRYGMGFRHPNTFGGAVFFTELSGLFIVRNHIKTRHIILIAISAVISLILTESRWNVLCIAFALMGVMLVTFVRKYADDKVNHIFQKILFGISFVSCFSTTALYFVWSWNYDIERYGDDVEKWWGTFASRLMLGYHALHEVPVTLFGIDYESQFSYALDNSFLYALFYYGVIILVFSIALFMQSCYRNRKDMFFTMLLIVLVLHYFMYERALCIYMNRRLSR